MLSLPAMRTIRGAVVACILATLCASQVQSYTVALGANRLCTLGAEGEAVQLQCDADNHVIAAIEVASYGTPEPSCSLPIRLHSSCNAPGAQDTVARMCLMRRRCWVHATNLAFRSDPCPRVHKRVIVVYTCAPRHSVPRDRWPALDPYSQPQEVEVRFAGGRLALQGGDVHKPPGASQSDLTVTLQAVPLERAFRGMAVSMRIERQRVCPVCGGRGGTEPHVHPCGMCNGTGVAAAEHALSAQVHQRHLMRCLRCGGYGTVVDPHVRCGHCRGQRTVTLPYQVQARAPPGFPDGYTVRFPGEGQHYPGSDPGGTCRLAHESAHVCTHPPSARLDLAVVFKLEPHARFQRVGDDLAHEFNITLKVRGRTPRGRAPHCCALCSTGHAGGVDRVQPAAGGRGRRASERVAGNHHAARCAPVRLLSSLRPGLTRRRAGTEVVVEGAGMPRLPEQAAALGARGDLRINVNVDFPERFDRPRAARLKETFARSRRQP